MPIVIPVQGRDATRTAIIQLLANEAQRRRELAARRAEEEAADPGGGGIGAGAGAIIGSFFGPVGAIIGAGIGQVAGNAIDPAGNRVARRQNVAQGLTNIAGGIVQAKQAKQAEQAETKDAKKKQDDFALRNLAQVAAQQGLTVSGAQQGAELSGFGGNVDAFLADNSLKQAEAKANVSAAKSQRTQIGSLVRPFGLTADEAISGIARSGMSPSGFVQTLRQRRQGEEDARAIQEANLKAGMQAAAIMPTKQLTEDQGRTVKQKLAQIDKLFSDPLFTVEDGILNPRGKEREVVFRRQIGRILNEAPDVPKGPPIEQALAANSKMVDGGNIATVDSKGNLSIKPFIPDGPAEALEASIRKRLTVVGGQLLTLDEKGIPKVLGEVERRKPVAEPRDIMAARKQAVSELNTDSSITGNPVTDDRIDERTLDILGRQGFDVPGAPPQEQPIPQAVPQSAPDPKAAARARLSDLKAQFGAAVAAGRGIPPEIKQEIAELLAILKQ